MVTIHDISRITGYSVSTVSKAMNNYSDVNEETRRIILSTAEKLGYIPNMNAKSLATKKSWTIGVVFEERTGSGITHHFFGKVLNEFKKHIELNGYDLLFLSKSLGNNPKFSYYEHCIQKGVDGVILLCTNINEEHIKRLLESSIPSVSIDSNTDLTNCVHTNNYKCVYEAVEYLIKKGHRKIAHIAGALKTFIGAERLRGYKDALHDYGIPFRDDYVLKGNEYSYNQGYLRGMDIAKMTDKPTAVVCASDDLAIGLMHAFDEVGIKVPDDISVIGFDNNELARFTRPSLTTINQNKEKIATEAAKILLAKIQNPKRKLVKKVIEGQLIERESVKSLN